MYNGIQDPVVQTVKGRERLFCPIAGCPHDYATQQGYLTQKGYNGHFVTFHRKSTKVGFLSRLDFGNPGKRVGLWEAAFKVFRQEDVRFIILTGGLISNPHLKKQLTIKALDRLWEELWGADYPTKKDRPDRDERVDRARNYLLDEWADELAKTLPQMRGGSKFVKIYVVTSPAPNYDGPVGAEVARRLAKRRIDIRYWGERSVRIPIKDQNKVIWVLVPFKASWRSKYYSTSVDRLIQDEQKQTSSSPPDLWAVGCFASSLQRTKGENAVPYVSIPALHNLQEVHTAENQVGVRVVEFFPQGRTFLARTYNFKDWTAEESRCIPDPPNGNELQRQIVFALKEQGAMTIGMLEDAIQAPRGRISKAIKTLNESGFRPAIILEEGSQLYRFDSRWVQNEMIYPTIELTKLLETTFMAFGCLHAGNVHTQYHWFVETVPALILERGSSVLVGAGDFIEGLEHNLMERGEVMMGLQYTQQEVLAARLVGTVMLKVFRARFQRAINNGNKRKPAATKLQEIVERSLVTFLYIEGNHGAWLTKKGVTPLTTFRANLVEYPIEGIQETLGKYRFTLPNLNRLVKAKVAYGEEHQLASGINIAIRHPFMARALTSSLRAQGVLKATGDAQVAVSANFHVAISVEQWQSETGQRVALQVGTIVSKTDFEHGRLKRVDTGVGHLRVLHEEGGRIVMTETAFFGEDKGEEYNNEDLLQAFMGELGI